MQSADNQGGSQTGSEAQTGGRPAAPGAWQPQSGPAPTTWSTDGGAADFLGLDQEVGSQAGAASGPVDASPGSTAFDGSHSWLLSLEGEGSAQGKSAVATPQSASALVDSELPPADEVAAESDASAPPTEPARRRSRAPLYALAAACVLAGGGWFGWQWWQGQQAATEIVATNPPANPAPKAKPPTKARAPKAPRTTPTEPTVAVTNTNPSPEPSSTPATEPATPFAFGPRGSDSRVAGFLAAHAAQSAVSELAPTDGHATVPPIALDASGFGLATEHVPSDAEPTVEDPSFASTIPEPEPEAGPRRTPRTRVGRSALRLATDEDLSGVWEAGTIPLDAIDKDARLMTPEVGRVRVTIHGGELFEGRLYALGQHLVWLDTDLGRMALESRQIARIEHLSSPDGTPKLGSGGSQALAGLPRMRVRTPGGMLYGKVIGRDERSVTLITDTGARITIDTTEIEPAPEKRSLIVRGAEKKPTGS